MYNYRLTKIDALLSLPVYESRQGIGGSKPPSKTSAPCMEWLGERNEELGLMHMQGCIYCNGQGKLSLCADLRESDYA
jgi:hypothetical protein